MRRGASCAPHGTPNSRTLILHGPPRRLSPGPPAPTPSGGHGRRRRSARGSSRSANRRRPASGGDRHLHHPDRAHRSGRRQGEGGEPAGRGRPRRRSPPRSDRASARRVAAQARPDRSPTSQAAERRPTASPGRVTQGDGRPAPGGPDASARARWRKALADSRSRRRPSGRAGRRAIRLIGRPPPGGASQARPGRRWPAPGPATASRRGCRRTPRPIRAAKRERALLERRAQGEAGRGAWRPACAAVARIWARAAHGAGGQKLGPNADGRRRLDDAATATKTSANGRPNRNRTRVAPHGPASASRPRCSGVARDLQGSPRRW